MTFLKLMKTFCESTFKCINDMQTRLTDSFYTSLNILFTFSPLVLQLAMISMPVIIGGGMFVYQEIVLLNNNHYSFNLMNNLLRSRIRSSPSYVCNPLKFPEFYQSYSNFREIRVQTAGLHVEIPSYVDSTGMSRIYYSTDVWACYNLHSEISYLLNSSGAFDGWCGDLQTRQLSDRYKIITTNHIWRHRNQFDFERLNVSRLKLMRIVSHSYVDQMHELNLSLCTDVFRASPSAYNYFNFRYKF